MNATRADAIVARRLRAAAAHEPLPGTPTGRTAPDIAASIAADTPHAARFRTEVAAAVTGTALALDAARPHPTDPWHAAHTAHPDPTAWFEQTVLLGHPTHPLARLRGDLDPDQIRAWAPEHRPRLRLGLYRPPGLHTTPDWPIHDTDGPLLPVHPCQADRLRLGPALAWIDHTAPLMNLRTLTTGTWHLKCAVDLQLTSAVRGVSPAAVTNGPALTALLTDPAKAAGITLLPEAAAAATGPDGRARGDLAAIARPAPHTTGADRPVPLAALAERCPTTGRPLAAAIARAGLDTWWQRLAAILCAPLRLLAATGVALEAHGQNTLITFDVAGQPTGMIYRDLGGIRLPATGWPALPGDLQTDDAAERRRKLLAALYPTTLTALVDALADWTGTEPAHWWRTIARTVRATAPPDLAEAVCDRPWPVKATTAMRLADNPTADIWAHTPNPMAGT